MSLYLGNDAIYGVYVGSAVAGVNNISLASPTISVNTSTGAIIATINQTTAGYVSVSSTSSTTALSIQAAKTVTPTNATQIAVQAGKFVTGNITVAAVPSETTAITVNGTYTPTTGKWFSSVSVNVPASGIIPTGTLSVTANGSYNVYNYATATVSINTPFVVTLTDTGYDDERFWTPNKTYSEIQTAYNNNQNIVVNMDINPYTGAADGYWANAENKFIYWTRHYGSVNGADAITEQEYILSSTGVIKDGEWIYYNPMNTLSITANGAYDISTYATATVDIPTGPAKSSSDLTVNGATVTVPAGLYSTAVTKSVANGTVIMPATVSASDATVTVSGSTITLSKQVTATPNVSTPGYISAGTSSSTTASLSATIITKAATTYTPSTTNQTIASGIYLSGTQTILGDSNLVAGNIKSGISIFGVTGTYAGSGGSGITPTGNLNITTNGNNIDVSQYATVSVNVPVIQNINITQDEDGYLILDPQGINNYTFINTPGTATYSNGEMLIVDNNYIVETTTYRLNKTLIYNWDLTQSLTDTINGVNITLNNSATQSSAGVTLSSATQYITIPVKYSKYMTYEFDISTMSVGSLNTHGCLIMMTATEGLIYRNGTTWGAYLNGSWATNSSSTNSSLFAGKTLKIIVNNGAPSFYIDNELWYTPNRTQSLTGSGNLMIGSSQGQGYFNITITGIRVYEGVQ